MGQPARALRRLTPARARARRALLAALAAVAIGGACAGRAPAPPIAVESSSTTATTRVAASPPISTVGPAPPTTRRSAGGAPAAASGHPAVTSRGDPLADAAKGNVGALAGPLLAANGAPRLVIELLLQQNLAPHQHTLDHVTAQIRAASGNKPLTITTTPVPAGPSSWTADQLNAFADRYATLRSGGTTAVVHLLFVHGQLGDTAGVATRADVIAAFPDTYAGGGLTASEAQIEDVIVMHETGHVLGLVDLWLATGRGDRQSDPAPGGHHSPNPQSVMYWRVETFDVKSFFRGGPPADFDAADRNDLDAIHRGAPDVAD